MRPHEIECEVPTVADEFGNPTTTPAGKRKIACVTCGASGYPDVGTANRSHWLRRHRHHVRCVCGTVVTEAGFGGHKGARGRYPTPVGA